MSLRADILRQNKYRINYERDLIKIPFRVFLLLATIHQISCLYLFSKIEKKIDAK